MEFETLGIGKEQPKIEAKPVEVLGYEEREVKFDNETSKKLVLKVKHPDIESIEIGKVKYEKNKKLKEVGLWLSKDKDGSIPNNSALAALLMFYRCNTIADLKGKTLETTEGENNFLVIKAY